MDARYAGALRAFISHQPSDAPIDPGAPDPLRERGPEAAPDLRPRVRAAAPTGETGAALLPLILAQLPLQPTYRLRRRPPTLTSALSAPTTNRMPIHG